jgi:hypothetical protein
MGPQFPPNPSLKKLTSPTRADPDLGRGFVDDVFVCGGLRSNNRIDGRGGTVSAKGVPVSPSPCFLLGTGRFSRKTGRRFKHERKSS